MVHSICIYVLFYFCPFFFFSFGLCLFMLLLVDYQNLSSKQSELDLYSLEWKNLELPRILFVVCFFEYLPYRSECVGKPCEMVPWPHVCLL